MVVRALKRLRMGGKEYFIDERLNQIRNVNNPHDFEDVSPELIYFWVNNCEQEGNMMVCKLDDVKLKKKFGRRSPDTADQRDSYVFEQDLF